MENLWPNLLETNTAIQEFYQRLDHRVNDRRLLENLRSWSTQKVTMLTFDPYSGLTKALRDEKEHLDF
jgi:hypothetical protein